MNKAPADSGRTLHYDILVMAIGSTTNDFATPGVAEHAICLNTPAEASRFHQQLVNACIRASLQQAAARRAIARHHHRCRCHRGGTGGRTAQHHARTGGAWPGKHQSDRDIRLTLIEAGPRILPALPACGGRPGAPSAGGLQVEVLTGERVSAVDANAVHRQWPCIASELVVWAAGGTGTGHAGRAGWSGQQPAQSVAGSPHAANHAG
jgi:NADH dehydrogenase